MPDEFVWDAIEGLFQVKECHADGLGLLTVLLQKQPSSVDGVRRSTPFDKTALVRSDGDNLAEPGIDNPFEYFHDVN